MELSMTWEEYMALDYQKLKVWAAEYQVRLWSCHLPFFPFADIELSDEAVAMQTIRCFTELIKKGTDIGIKNYVVHPSGEPIEEVTRAERMTCAKESLAKLAEIAEKYHATIAVENLPRTCLGRNSDEILELLSAHPGLRVCFDTNHLLEEESVSFLRKVGNKILTLHVSDYDFLNERHWMPGEGEIDWQKVLAGLKEIQYQGSWMYEVAYHPTVTIERRVLGARDFTKNAQDIFLGRKPEKIGERKKNLRSWKDVK